ncbi:MAG: hypothetical protein AAGG44_07165, partial [Planctomycetota bacterium]
MQIHSLQHSQATQSVNSTQNTRAASQNQSVDTANTQQADQLDLSPEALALGQAEAAPPTVNGLVLRSGSSVLRRIDG